MVVLFFVQRYTFQDITALLQAKKSTGTTVQVPKWRCVFVSRSRRHDLPVLVEFHFRIEAVVRLAGAFQ